MPCKPKVFTSPPQHSTKAPDAKGSPPSGVQPGLWSPSASPLASSSRS
eukprot:CAMPEP_0115622562 /NCGR_PEP_ID=MMETSP0272-20121206/26313_1 /TAXON_ID=71861 /ORGANISM="Scrippsiella trochoidea, Strain CCMP3099" /LENGTH=47 /DNA_ID= /DNA_START= /DNA_END= /DNA_ORIENTATION=